MIPTMTARHRVIGLERLGRGMAAALFGVVRDKAGVAIAEFALAFPFLVLLLLGGFEIGRYVLLEQKLESVAVQTADLVSQAQSISTSELDDIFLAASSIMAPFSLGDKGVIIVTSVSASGGQPAKVNWQRAGGGTASATSLIGTPGGNATLPAGFVVRNGESLIVAEAFYNFTPLLNFPLVPLSAKQLYGEGLYRPRFGSLSTLN
jgi:Flp pilus assembly protein TadG